MDEWTESPEDLAMWIRNHPEVWHHAFEDLEGDFDVTEESAIDRVLARSPSSDVGRRSRRRRYVIGGACSILVVAGGAVGVAALIQTRQTSHPETGARCLAAAELDADGILLSPGANPVDSCTKLWADGWQGAQAVVPPLTACINANGGIDVFPDVTGVCERLGLVSADPTLDAGNAAVVELERRLVEEINAGECQSVDDVVAAAERVVEESRLDGWKVIVNEAANGGTCGKVAVDSATRTVIVNQP